MGLRGAAANARVNKSTDFKFTTWENEKEGVVREEAKVVYARRSQRLALENIYPLVKMLIGRRRKKEREMLSYRMLGSRLPIPNLEMGSGRVDHLFDKEGNQIAGNLDPNGSPRARYSTGIFHRFKHGRKPWIGSQWMRGVGGECSQMKVVGIF